MERSEDSGTEGWGSAKSVPTSDNDDRLVTCGGDACRLKEGGSVLAAAQSSDSVDFCIDDKAGLMDYDNYDVIHCH